MSKTAKSKSEKKRVAIQKAGDDPAVKLWEVASTNKDRYQEEMLVTMRLLKAVNPGDAYLENYLGMIQKYGPRFFDTYHLLRAIGEYVMPKRILEIGTRTGISLCQLLVAHNAEDKIQRIVCVDPFDKWTSANLVRANLKALSIDETKVQILTMKSEDFFKQKGFGYFDYILVDGDHAKPAARMDLEAAHLMLAKGGIIVFDDISTNDGECGLITEWDDFLGEHGHEYYSYQRMEGKGVGWAIKR